MKLQRLVERVPYARCWFCRTDQKVNYVGKIVNTHPLSENRFMKIYVCEKCAENHKYDFIDWEGEDA